MGVATAVIYLASLHSTAYGIAHAKDDLRTARNRRSLCSQTLLLLEADALWA